MEPGARALLHANQPSLRLPAALPPSSQPPSSALPPPACGAPSFSAGPPSPSPPPPPASCSLAFPRIFPAAGKWNPATATASLRSRAPVQPPQAPFPGPGGTRATTERHPAAAPGARPDRGSAFSVKKSWRRGREPALSCALFFCWWIVRVEQRAGTLANSGRARGDLGERVGARTTKKVPGQTADPQTSPRAVVTPQSSCHS